MPSEADLTLRSADPGDVGALATLYVAARAAAVPAIPASVHDADQVHRWLADRVGSPEAEVWLAERDGAAPLAGPTRDLLASAAVGAVSQAVVTWASAGFVPPRPVVADALAGFLAGSASALVAPPP